MISGCQATGEREDPYAILETFAFEEASLESKMARRGGRAVYAIAGVSE